MKYLVFILSFHFLQDLPFKPKEEFEMKIDFQLKPRPPRDINEVQLNDSRRDFEQRTRSMVLPYVVLHLNVLKLPSDKMRLKISTNRVDKALIRKVSVNTPVELDLGFADDMKDRVTPHEYTLTFITAEKDPVDLIVIRVDEDGSFFVNGELRGKF